MDSVLLMVPWAKLGVVPLVSVGRLSASVHHFAPSRSAEFWLLLFPLQKHLLQNSKSEILSAKDLLVFLALLGLPYFSEC